MHPEDALKKLRVPKNVAAHSRKVAEIAVGLAQRLKKQGLKVDLRTVRAGALLHDAGRVETHGLQHGFVGGRMLRKLGFGEKVARIAERHVAAGLSASEAKRLGLPEKEFAPKTIEEKVVWYADKTSDSGKVERILGYCGKRSVAGKRLLALLGEMEARIKAGAVYKGQRRKLRP